MLIESILLPAVVTPALAALVLVAGTDLLSRRRRSSGGPTRGGAALALAAAFLAAFVAMTGWPRWMPVEATQRLFWFVGMAALLAPVLQRLRGGVRLSAVFALCAPMLALLLQSQIQHRWTPVESALWVLGLAVVLVAAAAAWCRAASPPEAESLTFGLSPGPGRWLHAAVRPALLGLTALCLGLTGSALLGQLAGALAVAATVVEGWQLLRDRWLWSEGDSLAWVLSAGGLLVIGFFYSDLTPIPAVLLAASFLLVGLLRTGTAPALRLVVLVPALVAAGLVVAAELTEDESDGYYDYTSLQTRAFLDAPVRT